MFSSAWQGVILIDPTECRIAKIDGTLFKEVSFGWGILGHLDKGGHFLVEQRDVGDDYLEHLADVARFYRQNSFV